MRGSHRRGKLYVWREQAQALETLAEEHRVLQQAYQAEHRRAEDLQRRVDDIVQFEEVHVPQIQARVRRIVYQHETDQLTIAEYQTALARQRDYSVEVEGSRSKIKYWRGQYEEAVRDFTVEIEGLEAKLIAVDDSQALVRQISLLQEELARSKNYHARSPGPSSAPQIQSLRESRP